MFIKKSVLYCKTLASTPCRSTSCHLGVAWITMFMRQIAIRCCVPDWPESAAGLLANISCAVVKPEADGVGGIITPPSALSPPASSRAPRTVVYEAANRWPHKVQNKETKQIYVNRHTSTPSGTTFLQKSEIIYVQNVIVQFPNDVSHWCLKIII